MNAQTQPSRFQRTIENCTLLVTLAMKITGLISGFNQLLIQDHHDSVALLLSALLIAGGQFSEGLVLGLIDRLAGGEVAPGKKHSE